MKKILCFTLFSSCMLLFACNGDDAGTSALTAMADLSRYTTIEWKDTVINFGSVKKGEKVHIVFKCKNTGDKPLFFSAVRPSCGCTVADYTKGAIPPGGEGQVAAEFDTQKSAAPVVHKTIFVRTNTKNHTPPYLVFLGEVEGAENEVDTIKK